MTSLVYFDLDELRKGMSYRLKEVIRTDEGNSYELGEWINRGGNAAVFKAQPRIGGNDVAVKFLINRRGGNPTRFQRETELLKTLKGEHITRYHGAGRVKTECSRTRRTNVLPFMVMELADCNLVERMGKEQRNVRYEEYAGQFRGLASALGELHNVAKTVHRDIKPENILVVGERWLLSDYGLCTAVRRSGNDLTPENANVGPKYWLSPEAHNRRLGCGDRICEASDVFQLASIFWYVATGRHPCGVVTKQDWTGPDKLFSCLFRSLYHDQSRRPQNGGELLNELEDAMSR